MAFTSNSNRSRLKMLKVKESERVVLFGSHLIAESNIQQMTGTCRVNLRPLSGLPPAALLFSAF